MSAPTAHWAKDAVEDFRGRTVARCGCGREWVSDQPSTARAYLRDHIFEESVAKEDQR